MDNARQAEPGNNPGSPCADGRRGPKPRVSILTATFNAERTLPRLIADLRAQSILDFEWVVADGGSTDGTIELLNRVSTDLRLDIDSAPDFGIYDALNRAVKRAKADHYLVVGADDRLRPEALAVFLDAAAAHPGTVDFVAGAVEIDGRPTRPGTKLGWFRGIHGEASSHSVGLLIRRALHEQHGLYSRKLPICADQLFVMKCIRAGATVVRTNIVVGAFSTGGTSGTDLLGAHTEYLRAQLASGGSRYVQLPLFLMRFLKNIAKY